MNQTASKITPGAVDDAAQVVTVKMHVSGARALVAALGNFKYADFRGLVNTDAEAFDALNAASELLAAVEDLG